MLFRSAVLAAARHEELLLVVGLGEGAAFERDTHLVRARRRREADVLEARVDLLHHAVLDLVVGFRILFAADRGDVPLMRLLIKLGADPLQANEEGTTPLLAAAGVGTNEPQEEAGEESEALEAVKLLLDLGANVNTLDKNGDTAMHGAAYNISPLVVKIGRAHV